MKTVSANWIAQRKKSKTQHIKKAYLYRRQWNSSQGKYVYESTPVEITNLIVNIGNINYGLDVTNLSEYQSGTVDITINDLDFVWNNLWGGLFYGYEMYLSKVRIDVGYKFGPYTQELITAYTGLIGSDFQRISDTSQIRISLIGLETILENAEAENVSTKVNDEVIGIGDGTTKDFYTTNKGVGRIYKVWFEHNTTIEEKYVGTDFSISQLNEKDLSAKISFVVAPDDSYRIVCKYLYWYQNQEFKSLIEKLLDYVDITDRVIEPPVFENFVWNSQTWDTEAEFNACSKNSWLEVLANGTVKQVLYTLVSQQTSHAYWNTLQYNFTQNDVACRHIFNLNYNGLVTKVIGYFGTTGGPDRTVSCGIATDNNGVPGTLLGSVTVAIAGTFEGEKTFVFTNGIPFNANTNYWIVYWGGFPGATVNSGTSAGISTHYHKLYVIETDWVNYIKSQNIDCGTSLQQFGNLDNWVTLYGEEIKFWTQSSANGTDWEEEKQISPTNKIMSTCIPGTTRYLLWIARFRTDNASLLPILDKVKANWATTSFKIALANFSGLTVKDAIEELARMLDYEFGFEANGQFFFRDKVRPIEPKLLLTDDKAQNPNLERLTNVSDGWEYIYNVIEASFGQYSKLMTSETEAESLPSSLSKYGERKFQISGGNLLADKNADIATSIAQRYYNRYREKRIRCKALTQFLPELDLSDVVELQKLNWGIKTPPIFVKDNADEFVTDENGNLVVSVEGYFAYQYAKIIAVLINLDNWRCEFDFVEVISQE